MTKLCQDRSQCYRDAVWGIYTWAPGQTNVDLTKPVRVLCGAHKPKPLTLRRKRLRMVRL